MHMHILQKGCNNCNFDDDIAHRDTHDWCDLSIGCQDNIVASADAQSLLQMT